MRIKMYAKSSLDVETRRIGLIMHRDGIEPSLRSIIHSPRVPLRVGKHGRRTHADEKYPYSRQGAHFHARILPLLAQGEKQENALKTMLGAERAIEIVRSNSGAAIESAR
jgi:hypothetical protein